MRIATWNVNSVKARLTHLLSWLEAAQPDLVCLQELKCESAAFPLAEINEAGWQARVVGQKAYNGVAILTRRPAELRLSALPGGPDDPQARYVEVGYEGVIVGGLYLPNGNPAPGEKFDYKLAWMRRLNAHARALMALEAPVILAGDFNLCPEDRDVFDARAMALDALCRPESRGLYRELLAQGWTDALRVLNPDAARLYSYWDYQGGAWPRDLGLRIDHALLSPHAADRLVAATVDKTPRGWEKASDHTPVIVTLASAPGEGQLGADNGALGQDGVAEAD